ncbi:RNA-binding S4 domain-containing protein [Anaerotignum faecicola]|nr:RNA-binding S4 domain-containing protein [Anaerotignum faecicola]
METVSINTEFIKLGQLLKLADMAEQGSEAKTLISEGRVLLNGQTEVQRGKKVRPGDVVEVIGVGSVKVLFEER